MNKVMNIRVPQEVGKFWMLATEGELIHGVGCRYCDWLGLMLLKTALA